MTSKWLDAVNQMVSYERVSGDTVAHSGSYFVRSQVHLFSLLHALALQTLREDEDLDKLVPESKREEVDEFGNVETLVVLGGLTEREREVLEKLEGRSYQVMGWLNRDILLRHKAGGVAVPPPVLGRGLQAISDGFNAFQVAAKIMDTLFPFPYAQLLNGLMIMFTISTPIAVSTFTNSIYIAAFLSCLAVVGIIALEEVAKEIENPFGNDANDLPLSLYQEKFNSWVKQLLLEHNILLRSGHDAEDIFVSAEPYQSKEPQSSPKKKPFKMPPPVAMASVDITLDPKLANGHPKATLNGYANGVANGHGNGLANGHGNGDKFNGLARGKGLELPANFLAAPMKPEAAQPPQETPARTWLPDSTGGNGYVSADLTPMSAVVNLSALRGNGNATPNPAFIIPPDSTCSLSSL
eukprot:CAMPEP_0114552300 /NCGR_PEP_ID=MMETSP0114-20121206/7054_1 /TAXON_ID=31324 /ORGANISM="Goniomonas sp, Strain m" /LENGTH=409 /DNA_ID=CAMNT_0001737173 /DNA_START=290 /DNA_END=1519 /DNA_ORIENTATION=-